MSRPAHPLSRQFDEAVAYAIDKHRDQERKGSGVSYVSHIFGVASIALEMECTEEEAIAALLHDVIEDGGGAAAEAEIRERFGGEVAEMVRANSDTDIEPKPPWRQRKVDYIEGIATKPIGAVRVSIADKLHNARAILLDHRTIGDELWSRFSAGPEDVAWYYRSLVSAFDARRDELDRPAVAALDELDRTVSEIETRVAGRASDAERRDDPRVRDAYLTEGGTARYPEGTKFRGHDINALLDGMDAREASDDDEPGTS